MFDVNPKQIVRFLSNFVRNNFCR